MFRTNKPEQAEGGVTQFGRALHELNIDILCADAPQAKGRVERAHKTPQDRLVKELRLAGANDIVAGNALLPAFMADYNRAWPSPPGTTKICIGRSRRTTISTAASRGVLSARSPTR